MKEYSKFPKSPELEFNTRFLPLYSRCCQCILKFMPTEHSKIRAIVRVVYVMSKKTANSFKISVKMESCLNLFSFCKGQVRARNYGSFNNRLTRLLTH